MLALMVAVVVSQSTSAGSPPPSRAVNAVSAWGAPVTWTEQGRAQQAWVSPIFVAEPAPSEAGATAVKRADAGATVVVERPTMRVWRVRDAAVVRAAVPSLVVVLHDLASSRSRLRVPLGAVCGGERIASPGLPALERVTKDARCLPDFWMPGTPR